MGSKNNPGKFDCYENALPDEPMFVLLGRDPNAPQLIEQWADRRWQDIQIGVRPQSDLAAVEEAQQCAHAMRDWRRDNDGKWRAKK